MQTHSNKGITIVEIVIGVSIASLVVIFISHTLTLFFAASDETLNRSQALYLAEEGHEILRYLRDSNWDILANELTVDTTYFLDVATTTLATTTAPELINGVYTRSFKLSDVERDENDDIVASGGTTDVHSLFVTFTVSWGTSSTSLTALLTNIHDI